MYFQHSNSLDPDRRRVCLFSQKEFLFCLLSVFILGLVAHAYGFLQDSFSHDSLNALYAGSVENTWKIQIGRFLTTPYRAIFRGPLTAPWLIGLLSLLWISVSVYLVVRMFNIKSRLLIVLIAGIFSTNTCVSCLTATYMHDLDVDMFALVMAAGAAFSWYIGNKKGFILGAVFSFASLSLYQSYISVTVVLIMSFCILSLLNGESYKKVLIRGLKAIAMIVIGGILYIIALKVVSAISGVSFQTEDAHSFNLLSRGSLYTFLKGIVNVYIKYIKDILLPKFPFSRMTRMLLGLMLILPAGLTIVINLFSRRLKAMEKLLILALCAFIPLGSNLSAILAQGFSHDLMTYPSFLTYVLALLIIYRELSLNSISTRLISWGKRITIISICLFLSFNVQASNSMYLKKDLEQEATLSLMTRIVYRMEEHEDYITGETPVAFIGKSKLITTPHELKSIKGYTGMGNPNAITPNLYWYFNNYQTYFEYKLNNPAVMCDVDTWTDLYSHPEVIEMPAYPAEGCMKLVDGVFVVRMGPLS